MKTKLLLFLVATFLLPLSLTHAKTVPSSSLGAGQPMTLRAVASSKDLLASGSLSGRGSDFATGLHQTTSTASFADLSATPRSIPLPPTWMIALLLSAIVLACRIFGLSHAREMADHEKDMHRAKAKMYSALNDR